MNLGMTECRVPYCPYDLDLWISPILFEVGIPNVACVRVCACALWDCRVSHIIFGSLWPWPLTLLKSFPQKLPFCISNQREWNTWQHTSRNFALIRILDSWVGSKGQNSFFSEMVMLHILKLKRMTCIQQHASNNFVLAPIFCQNVFFSEISHFAYQTISGSLSLPNHTYIFY